MNRVVFMVCGVLASLYMTDVSAQGRGGGQGGCRGNMQSQSSQSSGLNLSSMNFDQLANPYQQAFAQQAARQQAVQNVFQQQVAYQQLQAQKRQARRDRQLAAIARRKAEEAAKVQPAANIVLPAEQLADKRR